MELVEAKTGKIVFARFDPDEELLEAITRSAEQAHVSAGFFYLIGTLKKAKLGFYRDGKYETTEMNQPLEIVSCLGNISVREGRTFAHAHITVSDEKGRAFGGHVMRECTIGVTAELVLVEAADTKLLRKFDEKNKLYLWSLEKQRSKH